MKTVYHKAILICLAAAFIGCNANNPVKIGLVAPLTGPSSAVGLGIRNGFQMVFDEEFLSRKTGGRKLELIIIDDENNTAACLEVVKDLEAKGCEIIILGTTSEAGKEAVRYANAHGLFVLSPTISDDTLSKLDDFFLRINISSSVYGEYLAEAVSKFGGYKRVALLGDDMNASYKNLIFDSFKKYLTSSDAVIVYEKSFSSIEPLPYVEIVDAIKTEKADSVLIVAASTETALICKYFERAQVSPQVFLPPWPLTIDLIQNGGKAVENIIAVSIADMEFSSAASKVFERQYMDKYSKEPSFTAMFGYEAAVILRRVLNSVKTCDPQSLKNEILKIRKFDGLQGPIEFDDYGDALRSMFYFTVKNGQFERLN